MALPLNPRPQRQSFFHRNGRFILAVLLIALFVHDIFGAHGFLAMRRAQYEIKRLRAEIAKINADNQALADHVKALKSDPALIERIAREEMGLAKPGELIFKLPPPPDKQNNQK